MFGEEPEPTLLPWSWARDRLAAALVYWIVTVRPDGRPHSRPVWGAWHDDAVWFSTGSLALGNLDENPEITVHLESGSEVVIVEGRAERVDDDARLRPVVEALDAKYAWDYDPDNPEGPFFAVRPRVAFGWLADATGGDGGSVFQGSATRWRFDG